MYCKHHPSSRESSPSSRPTSSCLVYWVMLPINPSALPVGEGGLQRLTVMLVQGPCEHPVVFAPCSSWHVAARGVHPLHGTHLELPAWPCLCVLHL